MTENQKNVAKNVAKAEGAYLVALAIVSGAVYGISAIKYRIQTKRIANEFWSGLSAKDRNYLRKGWVQCGRDPDRFYDWTLSETDMLTKIVYDSQKTKKGCKILAKHLRKQLDESPEPVEEEKKEG